MTSHGVIAQPILHRLRKAVCAVGHKRDLLSEWSQAHEVPGVFNVLGTGFLIREGVVITNRHVIDDLGSALRNGIREEQLFVLFIVFRGDERLNQLALTPRLIRFKYTLRDSRLDVGFVGFNVVHADHFQDVEPVEIDDPASISVSEEIAAFGYPHGNALLEKDGRVRRFGPVLQRGWCLG